MIRKFIEICFLINFPNSMVYLLLLFSMLYLGFLIIDYNSMDSSDFLSHSPMLYLDIVIKSVNSIVYLGIILLKLING